MYAYIYVYKFMFSMVETSRDMTLVMELLRIPDKGLGDVKFRYCSPIFKFQSFIIFIIQYIHVIGCTVIF